VFYIISGYNPKGWVGYGEARGSIAAFLFVFRKGLTEVPFKLRKTGGPSFAQNDLPGKFYYFVVIKTTFCLTEKDF
jgi:hypothetical protein